MVAAALAEQYARGGRPRRAVGYYRRAADVAAGMFAHAEAIRLHKRALSIVRGLPAGRDQDGQELAVLEAMAAPLNLVALWATQFVQGRIADGYQTATRALALVDPGSQLTVKLASGAVWLSVGTRADVQGTAWGGTCPLAAGP